MIELARDVIEGVDQDGSAERIGREFAAARAECAGEIADLKRRLRETESISIAAQEGRYQAERERDLMAFERDTHMEVAQNHAATYHTNGVQSLQKQVSELETKFSAAQAEIERLTTEANTRLANETALWTKLSNLRAAAEGIADTIEEGGMRRRFLAAIEASR